MNRRRLRLAVPLTALVLGATCAIGAPPGQAAPVRHGLSPSQRIGLAAGLQLAPKTTPKVRAGELSSTNPYLSTLADIRSADYAGWQQKLAAKAKQRASSPIRQAAQRAATGRQSLRPPLLHDEQEPATSNGSNDTRASAEPVGAFGTGKRDNPRLRILGNLADVAPAPNTLTGIREDNGQLDKATPTGIDGVGAVSFASRLGDGPHGSKGDGHNDYDFYRLRSTKGLRLTVDTRGSGVDTVVGLYDARGNLLDVNDDAPGDFAGGSLLSVDLKASGTYYVLIAGFGPTSLPPDPTNSGSGEGGNAEGDYKATISSGQFDTDYYALDLAKGDVLGATVTGATTLTIYRPDGTQMIGAPQVDPSGIYPPSSPLPGGGATTLAYVAEGSGRYAVRVDGPSGRYDATVEDYRPGFESDRSGKTQTIFLDFDGERLNTGIFGGPGVRTLSPFSAFIARWGLSRSQEGALIDRITATVTENIQRDLAARGLNKKLAVKVVNSRNSRDVFGQPNVSRVVVGGTIAESGIPTIGIAQYIDPGNYSRQDTAIVLLDVLSDTDPNDDASLNYYLRRNSDRVGFVSRAVGNVVSHEIGHYLGNFHTDSQNSVHNLMDEGGSNFGANLYGVGPDGIGGTADDEDIDYRTDTYSLFEGFTGKENTLNVSAWALGRR